MVNRQEFERLFKTLAFASEHPHFNSVPDELITELYKVVPRDRLYDLILTHVRYIDHPYNVDATVKVLTNGYNLSPESYDKLLELHVSVLINQKYLNSDAIWEDYGEYTEALTLMNANNLSTEIAYYDSYIKCYIKTQNWVELLAYLNKFTSIHPPPPNHNVLVGLCNLLTTTPLNVTNTCDIQWEKEWLQTVIELATILSKDWPPYLIDSSTVKALYKRVQEKYWKYYFWTGVW